MKIDLKAVFLSLWLPAFWWLTAVAAATLTGYPGVICVTPMGWLLALPAGSRCVQISETSDPVLRLVEAGIAGALLGLIQGIVFAVVLALASPLGFEQSGVGDTLGTALIALALTGGAGTLVCAAIAVGMGALALRRV